MKVAKDINGSYRHTIMRICTHYTMERGIPNMHWLFILGICMSMSIPSRAFPDYVLRAFKMDAVAAPAVLQALTVTMMFTTTAVVAEICHPPAVAAVQVYILPPVTITPGHLRRRLPGCITTTSAAAKHGMVTICVKRTNMHCS
jgi:hypothetical protein